MIKEDQTTLVRNRLDRAALVMRREHERLSCIRERNHAQETVLTWLEEELPDLESLVSRADAGYAKLTELLHMYDRVVHKFAAWTKVE